MHPLGALMLAQAIEDEREAVFGRRRNRPAAEATPARESKPGPWSAILRFPRFGLADARG